MIDFFRKLFDSDFMPHGHCYFWTPEIVWPIAISNGIIALAYLTIPIVLIYIYRKRSDFKYVWMAVIFALFIFGCGLTHVLDIVNIWEPYYRLDAVVRVITALASIGAAVVLTKITPNIIKMPTREEWVRVNEELREQIRELHEKDMVIEAIRKFEELAEAVPQVMWISDKSGKIFYINHRWHEYTGSMVTNIADVSNDYWVQYIHPDDFRKAMEQWRVAVEEGVKFDFELRIKDRGGNYQWFLSRSLPMMDKTDLRWFGTFTNIHNQKKQNEELRKINSDLDNFVYAASHDLRTPLTNMMGILNLLNDESEMNPLKPEKKQKYLQMLGLSVDKLSKIIDDLTDITRLQKNIFPNETVIMEVVVKEMSGELQEQISKTSAVITTDFQVPEIIFSAKNLRSILINLVTNALKYKSPDRSPEITIRTYGENEFNVIEVLDNGIGFDNKYKDIIFDLFKRLHSNIEGTGVGLFIVKRIVENVDGKIDVKSTPGVGSSFKIYLRK